VRGNSEANGVWARFDDYNQGQLCSYSYSPPNKGGKYGLNLFRFLLRVFLAFGLFFEENCGCSGDPDVFGSQSATMANVDRSIST
jgi:hypothetical protein